MVEVQITTQRILPLYHSNDLHITLKLHKLPLAWSVKKMKYWLKKKITLWNVIIKKVLFSVLPLQIAVPEANDSSWCKSFALSLYNTWEIYHWAIATTSILKHSSCSVKDNYHQTFHYKYMFLVLYVPILFLIAIAYIKTIYYT